MKKSSKIVTLLVLILIIFTSSASASTTQSKADKVLQTAKSYTGVRYVSRGTSPRGFDCSGYTQFVLKKSGINIPRTAARQYSIGSAVKKSNLKVGDLVFFSTYKRGASHVGIYAGNNKFIHSSSSKGVTTTSLSNVYWKTRYIGARRIIK